MSNAWLRQLREMYKRIKYACFRSISALRTAKTHIEIIRIWQNSLIGHCAFISKCRRGKKHAHVHCKWFASINDESSQSSSTPNRLHYGLCACNSCYIFPKFRFLYFFTWTHSVRIDKLAKLPILNWNSMNWFGSISSVIWSETIYRLIHCHEWNKKYISNQLKCFRSFYGIILVQSGCRMQKYPSMWFMNSNRFIWHIAPISYSNFRSENRPKQYISFRSKICFSNISFKWSMVAFAEYKLLIWCLTFAKNEMLSK